MPKTLGKEIRKLREGVRRDLPKSWNKKIDKTIGVASSNLYVDGVKRFVNERSERGRARLFGRRKKRR